MTKYNIQSGLGITLLRIFSFVRGHICLMILRSSAFSFAVFDFTKKKTRTVRFVEMLHVYMKSNQPTLLWKAGY